MNAFLIGLTIAVLIGILCAVAFVIRNALKHGTLRRHTLFYGGEKGNARYSITSPRGWRIQPSGEGHLIFVLPHRWWKKRQMYVLTGRFTVRNLGPAFSLSWDSRTGCAPTYVGQRGDFIMTERQVTTWEFPVEYRGVEFSSRPLRHGERGYVQPALRVAAN